MHTGQAQRLAAAAHQWTSSVHGPKKPRFSAKHRDMLVELAFLKAFLAWESFIEETFILYMLGKKPPRRAKVKCLVSPPSREHAILLTLPEAGTRPYADWDNVLMVRERAKRFFDGGEPFETALSLHVNLVQEIQTIRHALVHRSKSSQERFETIARRELTALPLGLTVGRYLTTTRHKSIPPISYFEFYTYYLKKIALKIVPS